VSSEQNQTSPPDRQVRQNRVRVHGEGNFRIQATDASEAADKQAGARKARRQDQGQDQEEAERGTISPAQHDDDGWGQTPVQMRG
jgi:hypothetical protein